MTQALFKRVVAEVLGVVLVLLLLCIAMQPVAHATPQVAPMAPTHSRMRMYMPATRWPPARLHSVATSARIAE